MNKAHSAINWLNEPNTDTPINATNLNKMDSAIGVLDDRIIVLDTTKASQSDMLTAFDGIAFDKETGILILYRKNGAQEVIDTGLAKVTVNLDFDDDTQQFILYLADGTEKRIDASALITQNEFIESDTVYWTVSADGKVKADIKKGSITEEMFDPTYLAEIKLYSSQAVSSATDAQTYANEAKQSADLATELNEESKELLEQVKKTVSVVEFDVNENGYLTYTTDTEYVFGVDDNGNLTWEVE